MKRGLLAALILGFLGFTAITGAAQEVELIGPNAECRYFIPTDESDAAIIGLQWIERAEPAFVTTWQHGLLPIGYSGTGDTFYPFTETQISEMREVASGLYTRTSFDIDSADSLAALQGLLFRIRMEDGFVAYLNGTEVLRMNAPDDVDWTSLSTGSYTDFLAAQYHEFDLSSHLGLIEVGSNVLAVHGLNNIRASQDFFLGPELVATTTPATPAIADENYLQIIEVEASPHISNRWHITVGVAVSRVYFLQRSHDLVTWETVSHPTLAQEALGTRLTFFDHVSDDWEQTYFRVFEQR